MLHYVGLAISDSYTMFKRCMVLSLRNLEAFFVAVCSPILMMLLFVYVLGGAMNVGDISYINYIVPGIILQAIGQSATTTAVRVNTDMKEGIMNRFKSMPIIQSSILVGHTFAAVIRSIISTLIIFGIAFIMGFQPNANIGQWLMVGLLLFLFMLAVAWLSVVFGLIASSAETASAFAIILSVLPYFSSGFVPTDTMPYLLRVFAQHQPITSLIEALRSFLMNAPQNPSLIPAIIWCIGILLVSFIISVYLYKKKM